MINKHFSTFLSFILILHTASLIARQISCLPSSGDEVAKALETSDQKREVEAHTLIITKQMAGSRLPDCSHACGSCKPCKLVIVSFACASLAEAETCPISYKCMCNNKSYPIP